MISKTTRKRLARRTALRTTVTAALVSLGVIFSASEALAATSYQSVRVFGTLAGEVWYNSGTHNMSKGRNSFTLKDHGCNDGWNTILEWQGARSGIRTVKCGEQTFSIETADVARQAIFYNICNQDIHTGIKICAPNAVQDYID